MANISGYIKSLVSSLATVATSGSYTDLTNKPSLATVATSGSYTDLTNKPVQQGGKKILLSNSSTNPNTQIDFSEGVYAFSDGSSSANLPAMTGDITLNFGNGLGMLDTGTRANSTWYYCYAIYNPTTQLSRVICSVSAPNLTTGAYTGSNMPSGFTQNRYIGAFRTGATGNIIQGNWFADGTFTFRPSTLIINSNVIGTGVTITNVFPSVNIFGYLNLALVTSTAGYADFGCFGNLQTDAGANTVNTIGTNNGFATAAPYAVIEANNGAVTVRHWSVVGTLTGIAYAKGYKDLLLSI